MDHFNLLDLDNDVLNIIGDYVKADNYIREFNELKKKTYLIMLILKMKIIRKEAYYLNNKDRIKRNKEVYLQKKATSHCNG
jgi:hypothetical protein